MKTVIAANVAKIIKHHHSDAPERGRKVRAAERIKMKPQQLKRVLREAHNCRIDTIERIAVAYGYEPYKLLMTIFEAKDPPDPDPALEEINDSWGLLSEVEREKIVQGVRNDLQKSRQVLDKVIDRMSVVQKGWVKKMGEQSGVSDEDARPAAAPADNDSKGTGRSKRNIGNKTKLVGPGGKTTKTARSKGAQGT